MKILFAIALLSWLVHIGGSLECYKCIYCPKITAKTITVECDEGEICYYHSISEKTGEKMDVEHTAHWRGCDQRDHCDVLFEATQMQGAKLEDCVACPKDRCNSVTSAAEPLLSNTKAYRKLATVIMFSVILKSQMY